MAEAAEDQQITPAPVRRWVRRVAVLLGATALLGALVQAPGVETAEAAPTGSRTVSVSITELSPATPKRSDTLTVSGRVTNRGRTPVTDVRVGLRVGAPLYSRSAVRDAANRDGTPTVGAEVPAKYAARFDQLAPGVAYDYTLEVPVKALGLGAPGVYALGVTLTGQTRYQPYPQVLGAQQTVLPWRPAAAAAKTHLTFLWPLVSGSHLTARTGADERQTPILASDDLLPELSPGGRLQQMVALGKDLPVTWVIDPDLLATVEAMTKPYRVSTEDGGTVPGRGQDQARQWLSELEDAVQGREVVALPFGDPDVASLAHRGKNVSGALGQLGPATELAELTVETILGVRPSTDYAWPVEGAIDPSIVSVATSAGAHRVIARSDSLRDRGLPYTPSAARPIGRGVTAVVADAWLSTLFERDLTRADSTTAVVQQFLAQTQAITSEAPERPRHIVVAPQRRPTASQAQAMAEAVRAVREHSDWVSFADLSAAATADPDPRANRTVPSAAAYPEALRKKELPTAAFAQMQQTQGTLDGFTVILTQSDRVETPVGNAIRRQMSTSWRGDREGAAEYRDAVEDYLVGLTKKVRLIQKSPITLSGRSATIPVTVQNNLLQTVEGLELRLTSSRRIGLEVGDPQPVRVAGGHSQSVKFTTTAKANGRAYLEAQLYTRDNKPFGAPMTFQAKVTDITSTVLLVIAGGVLLVVLAGLRMYTQRKRAARAAAAASPEAAAEAAGGGNAPGATGTAAETAAREDGDRDGDRDDARDGDAPGDEAGAAGGGEDAGTALGENAEVAAGRQARTGATDTGDEDDGPSAANEKVDR